MTMKSSLHVPAAWFIVLLASGARGGDPTSELWGTAGEKWTPGSRLPDFSQAGYRRGEEPYRIPADKISVKDFGATGDGKTDDTGAFKRAIAAGPDKLVLIPKGRYVLTDILEIQQPRLVLRGAGPEQTVLLFIRPLQTIKPTTAETGDGKTTTAYSWSGGLISVAGQPPNKGKPAPVTAAAKRGEAKLTLAAHSFKAGDEVLLSLTDTEEKSLLAYLYRGQAGDMASLKGKVVQQVFRVTSVKGAELTLDRGLRFDVKDEWKPTVSLFAPDVTDVGVEELGFEFPAKAYAGHWEEVGFNPVQLSRNVAHCWIRNIRVWNADNGPFISGWFCTVEGITFGADRRRCMADGKSGHHGVSLQGSDGLCTDFRIKTRFFHDVTIDNGSIGNVFSKGSALDFNMDHHRHAPYETLFTDIDAGDGTRLFNSGGSTGSGNHSAAGSTFWNIRTKQEVVWPEDFQLDAMNFVALKTRGKDVKKPDGRWIETIHLHPGHVAPPDLHLAMQQTRQAGRASAAMGAAPPVAAAARSWKSVDGRVIEAQFAGIQGDQVALIRTGQRFVIPLAQLSAESQALARQLAGGAVKK